MRVPKPEKGTLGKMMEREEKISKVMGCPPGHTYNENIKKCIPGSPLSGIKIDYGAITGNVGGSQQKPSKPALSADALVQGEAYQRASQGVQQ